MELNMQEELTAQEEELMEQAVENCRSLFNDCVNSSDLLLQLRLMTDEETVARVHQHWIS